MLKVFTFLGVLLVAAIGLGIAADTPGQVSISWDGQLYQFKLVTAAILVLGFGVGLTMAWSLLRAMLNLPGLVAASSGRSQARRGYQAVSRGMIAVGSGDLKGAERHAREASRLIDGEPAALLLAAQAAQLAGKRADAETAFTRMLERPETKLLGLRGLFIEARRNGDDGAARYFAGEAFRLQPGVPWVSSAALEERCRAQDWEAAGVIVEQAVSRRITSKLAGRRQRAVLLTARAIDAQTSNAARALEWAREALKLEPGLVPAAALAGRLLGERGDIARASRLIEAAWRLSPHPALADVYLNARPGDSSLDRLARAKKLQALAPAADDGALAVAAAAAGAREFKLARETLAGLTGKRAGARVCLAMAEIEQRENGSSGLAREWLARAARAPRDRAWVADGHVSRDWMPVSPVTGRLDAFVWQAPPQAAITDNALTFDAGVNASPLLPPALPPAVIEPPLPASAARDALPPPPDDPGPKPRAR